MEILYFLNLGKKFLNIGKKTIIIIFRLGEKLTLALDYKIYISPSAPF
jgi:hypothetical protein